MEKRHVEDMIKYQKIENVSYGSTSYVYKVKKRLVSNFPVGNKNFNTNVRVQQFPMAQFEYQEREPTIDIMDQVQKQALQLESVKIFKSYNIQKLTDGFGNFIEEIKYNLLTQTILLKYLDHPGIVRSHSLYTQYSKVQGIASNAEKLSLLGIVMQNCQKGPFFSLLKYIDRTKILKENRIKIIRFYLAQLINVLIYLNKKCSILHRDIKAENILISKQLDLKLADFGTATMTEQYLSKFSVDHYSQIVTKALGINWEETLQKNWDNFKSIEQRRKNLIGSKHYISPELVNKNQCDIEMVDGAFDKTDIWSFGILVYKIFHDKFPFQGRNLKQTIQRICDEEIQFQIDPNLPADVKELIEKTLIKDYTARFSWNQIQKLKFFKGINIMEIYNTQSPIITLFREDKKKQNQKIEEEKHQQLQFEQKFMITDEQSSRGKRRTVMVVKKKVKRSLSNKNGQKQKKQSQCQYYLRVLKDSNSVSAQVPVDTAFLSIHQERTMVQVKGKSQLQIYFLEQQNRKSRRMNLSADTQLIEKFRDFIVPMLTSHKK